MARSFVFLGVPEIGQALARNLLEAGYAVAGGIDSADIVVSLCARQSQLEDAYYEAGGVIANAAPGTYVVECSATTPAFAKELSAMATVNELRFVEAPLVVRDPTLRNAYADSGNLLALAAGDEADVQAMLPIIQTIAASVEYCGKAGRGQLAKCSITMQQCAQLASIMEADALCRKDASEDVAARIAAIAVREQLVAPGVAFLRSAMEQGSFNDGCAYSVEVLWGELESALAASDEVDLIVPQAEATLYLLELLATIGGITMGPAALQLAYCDEETVAKHGLDWSRAEQVFQSVEFTEEDGCCDECDDFDDYNFDDDDGSDGDDGFGMGFGADYAGWSSN